MPLYGDAKREYQLAWLRRRRGEWVESRGGRCESCGSQKDLEIDHTNPSEKTLQPRNIWSRADAVRHAELAKCQVLCAECHQAKTSAEQTVNHEHGTYRRYQKGCRCGDCTATVAPHWRERRANAPRAIVER